MLDHYYQFVVMSMLSFCEGIFNFFLEITPNIYQVFYDLKQIQDNWQKTLFLNYL